MVSSLHGPENFFDGSGTLINFPSGERMPFLHLYDEKATGVDGGVFTQDVWQTRDLNTMPVNEVGAVLSSNQLTLFAGSYMIMAWAPVDLVGRHKMRLRDTTNSVDLIIGGSAFTDPDAGEDHVSDARLMGRFNLSATTTLELQHQCSSTKTVNGFGVNAGFSTVERYAELLIWKVDKGIGGANPDWEVIEQRLDISASSTEDFFWPEGVYDEIEITLTGYVPSSDNTDLDLMLSTDGSTFHTTAGDYQWAYAGGQEGAAAILGGSASDVRIRITAGGGTGTDEHVDIKINLTNVSNTTRKNMLRYAFWGKLATTGLFVHVDGGAVLLATNDALRGFSLDSAGATTFSADSITIRGRRLSPQIGLNAQDWEVIEVQELTSAQATIEFKDIPSNQFDELELSILHVNSDTSGQSIELRFSNDNGATFDSGANYKERGQRHQVSGTSAENTDAQSGIQIMNNFGSATDRLGSGFLRLWSLNAHSEDNVRVSGLMNHTNDSDDTTAKEVHGEWLGTGSTGLITAFQLILTAGGNFSPGAKFILRGRRKAA